MEILNQGHCLANIFCDHALFTFFDAEAGADLQIERESGFAVEGGLTPAKLIGGPRGFGNHHQPDRRGTKRDREEAI